MVYVYKKPVGAPLHLDNKSFNTRLSKPRVSSEHMIGILMGRFPFLRSIWMWLTSKTSFKEIHCYITVCIILHNFLVGNREDHLDELCDNDGLSEIDADNDLNQPVADYSHSSTHCKQIRNYVLKKSWN
jgi:hypothetical protein